jgi:putative hemolysin
VASLLQEALVGQEHGEHQSSLIDRVIGLSETPVRSVMVPGHRVIGVAASASRRDLIRVGRVTPFARVPVFGERRLQVMGFVKVEELLRNEGWTTVGERMQPATKLSPATTAAAAIAQMRRAGSEMAVVVDAVGNMLGVVTLRDLLEEVVGEFGGMN